MNFQVKVGGGKELAAGFAQLPPRVGKRILLAGLKEAGEPMRARMGELAPREPGAPDLADNIVISTITKLGKVDGEVERTDEKMAAVAVGPSKGFFYGFFQEFGTIRHGAHAFVRPAYDALWQGVIVTLGKFYWAALSKREVLQSGRGSSSGGGTL